LEGSLRLLEVRGWRRNRIKVKGERIKDRR
jgi:hypothetical protein